MIKLIQPSQKWADHFDEIKKEIMARSEPIIIAVEHIGSTSIENMPSKDIVDIQCAVRNFDDIDLLTQIFAQLGFYMNEEFKQDHVPFHEAEYFHPDWEKRFFKGRYKEQDFNIHIRKISGLNWQFALNFRETLRNNPQLHKAYLQCKERLIAAKVSPQDYCLIKDSFIDLISLHFI